jgi:hypothetical protein
MDGLEITFIDNSRALVLNHDSESFLTLVNSDKQFLSLRIISKNIGNNPHREYEPYDGLTERVNLNKAVIKEF